jgi:ADP-heptose:LPS heptosyltransferase
VSAERILVVRNDKLGDFMLAWPAIALLAESLPEAKVDVLVPEYTRELAEVCPWVDRVVIDPGRRAGVGELTRRLREGGWSSLIALFSTTRVALAARRAGIEYRLAPATKLAQFLYTHRIAQRRSRSEKPEFEYNNDLVRHFLAQRSASAVEVGPPYLRFDEELVEGLEREFRERHGVDGESLLVFLHPGSGGSARNLTVEQYARLADRLGSGRGHVLVVTAGPGEEGRARELARRVKGSRCVVHLSEGGLLRFAHHLAFADLFISGSTGTLHVAGALDRPTAAFYPRRRSSTPLRWKTLNSPGRHLAWCPEPGVPECDLSSIDLAAAARSISETFLAG